MADDRKVLIVDDTRSVRSLIYHEVVNELGIPADAAGSLAEAEQMLTEQPPSEFFVAVLDLNLPDAPNGEMVQFALGKGLRVIVLTGTYSGELIEQVRDERVLDIIVKRNIRELDGLFQGIRRLHENFDRRVMVVDDSASSRMYMGKLLENQNLQVIEMKDGPSALRYLETEPAPDVLVTDFNMPGMMGDELAMEVRGQHGRNTLAIIGVSSTDKPDTSVRLLKAGANDFIHRPFSPDEFYCRLNLALDSVRSFQLLRDASLRDFLTQLHNRMYLYKVCEPKWQEARDNGSPLAVAMLDIDHFKAVNDTHGHHIGDLALKHVANLLRRTLPNATVCRTGGEEFCVFRPGADLDTAAAELEHTRIELESTPLETGELQLPVTVSIGVTDQPAASLQEMIDAADLALYRAKQGGRNRLERA